MLDLVHKALDQMAFSIDPGIVRTGLLAALMRWDDRFCSHLKDKVDEVLSCISAVGNHILANEPFTHLDCLGTIMAFACGQSQAQRVAQTIDGHMDLGTEATSTTPQGLLSLAARFFVRLPRMDEREQWCYLPSRFPYPGLVQSTQTSLARCLLHTNEHSACRRYSNFRRPGEASATVHHFAESIGHLLQSAASCAMTRLSTSVLFAETLGFSTIGYLAVSRFS
jgi:hypothetical protein